MVKQNSEFGTGLSYCLGLFLAHAERKIGNEKHDREIDERYGYPLSIEMWFNGASDHLYELQIPDTLPITLQKRLKSFQSKVLEWGHGFKRNVKVEDKDWSIEEAKELLRAIDRAHNIKTIKGDWR